MVSPLNKQIFSNNFRIFNILHTHFGNLDYALSCRFWFAQHERTLTGASPQIALIVGRLQPRARVSIVRWNLKEAGGKRLAR